jgi:hypothetical protein
MTRRDVPSRRPSRGTIALGVVFLLLALNALAQGVLAVLGESGDPAALVALQACIGLAGLAASWGSFRRRRWAPLAALAHGIVTAAMLVSLESILGLEREARAGLWTGAAIVLAFDAWAAWYLRRVVGRAR